MPSPYRVRNKPSKKRSNRIKLLFLLSLFTLVLGAFIYAVMTDTPPQNNGVKAPSPYPSIHAEDLGKNPSDLKNKYPDLFLSNDRYGNLVGRHILKNINYHIWFVAENKEKVAFRIRATKKYKSLKEKEVLKYFGSLYGRPFDGQCTGKSTFAIDKCHFKWWVREMVSLDVSIRYTSKKTVTLSTVTTDTYLSTKYHNIIKSVLPIQ